MRILIEFTDPETGDDHEIIMDGPDVEPEELRDIVVRSIQSALDIDVEDLNLTISEIAGGTIH